MQNSYVFTSESVCSGHPDKICDQVSDAIVDAILSLDQKGRVAVETLVTQNRIVLAGEVSLNTHQIINFEQIARDQLKKLGYTNPILNFTYKSPIEIYIHQQSSEIAVGVDSCGAGDQGMMFGYACNETEALMPLPITLAHAITKRIDEVREKKILPYLRPDGKSQVGVEYKNDKPFKIDSIVVAVPHKEDVKLQQVKEDLYNSVISPILNRFEFSFPKDKIIVNGTGLWHIGGPSSDTGVTGRKIVVDTYGGYARVGGGCFSGKDPTKVDRSGAYAARFIAKNIIAHKLATKAEVRLAYVIGKSKPLMQDIETFNTEKVSQDVLKAFASKILDTSVNGILEGLSLRQPIYLPTASYGHFGRPEFPWERIVENF